MTARQILVLGAGGFIGGRLVAELIGRGHGVICAGRDPARLRRRFPACPALPADLSRDRADDWRPRLAGIDAVVNAAGLLRGALDAVQTGGAIQLFDACAAADIPQLLQISALGAGQQPDSRFLDTKARADDHLLHLAAEGTRSGWHVVRPSLVVGRGGASTALFCALATGPMPIRLGPGGWRLQPIHVADLARILADLVEGADAPPIVVAAGPEAMTTDGLTAEMRRWLDLPPATALTLPAPLLHLAARIGTVLPGASLTPETLGMLAAGNVAADLPAIVTRTARPLATALAEDPAQPGDRLSAAMVPVKPLLLASLVALWLGTGAVSLLIDQAQADRLLAGLGLSGTPALLVSWAGAILDVGLGMALLRRCWRRRVLTVQIGLVLAYTILATTAAPDLWLDPLGSVLKNLPILAATLALLVLER